MSVWASIRRVATNGEDPTDLERKLLPGSGGGRVGRSTAGVSWCRSDALPPIRMLSKLRPVGRGGMKQ